MKIFYVNLEYGQKNEAERRIEELEAQKKEVREQESKCCMNKDFLWLEWRGRTIVVVVSGMPGKQLIWSHRSG